ncbi:MAG: Kelch repeat-containing protein [Planctomycetaceae bacterium]
MLLYLWGITRCCCGAPVPDAYCLGGLAANPNDVIAQVDGYRNATDAWSSCAALPFARRLHAGAFTGGFGYAVGGQSTTAQIDDHDEYAPVSDSWAARTAFPSPARNQLAAVGVSIDDAPKLFAFAGQHFSGVPNDHVRNDEYDIVGDAWSSKADKPAPALRAPAYAEVAGNIYSWGGFAGDGTTFGGSFRSDNDEYDPIGDAWSSRAELPAPARDAMMGGGSIAGKGYALGGRSAAPNSGVDTLDEYDPAGDAWTTRGPSPVPRCFIAACSCESRLHGFGGNHLTESQTVNHQCYEPATDSWLTLESLPPFERTQSAAFAR